MASGNFVTLLLAFVGLLFGSAHAQYMYGGGMPMYGGMGYGGGFGMMGGGFGGMGGGMGGGYPMMGGTGLFDGFSSSDDEDGFGETLSLTCVNNNTNDRGFMTDAIAVTIGYNDQGFQGFNSFDPYGMSGFPNGGSQQSNLKATVQILSSAQGTGTIVFTKMARVENGCSKFTMGGIHSPPASDSGMGLGFGMMGLGTGFGRGSNSAGIIKQDIGINFNLQTIFIDSLDGWNSLSDLAGRGVAVCSDSSFGWDFEAECEGPMFACCALKYDNSDVGLSLDQGFRSSSDYDNGEFRHLSETVTYQS